jgi:ABC-2 type transport system ATP-binding protein
MTGAILAVRDVSKAFGEVQAVDGVTLDVQPGEVFGLLGPNGAGKTTLIRMLLDIYRPDRGEVTVFGHKMGREDLDLIGYLPEERGLYRRRKVIQVLRYLGQLKGLSRTDATASAEHWLERMGIPEHRDKKLEALSKGNQQKIQLIATLVGSPKLLVWDEPFSGLDPVNTARVRDLVIACRDAGSTVVLSTHLMNQAEALCDRVGLIDNGRLVLYGPIDEVRGAHGEAELELETDVELSAGRTWPEVAAIDANTPIAGSPGMRRFALRLRPEATTETLLRRLLEAGGRVTSFRPRRPTLEEIFLRAVDA